jgi:hypothetical protein
LQGKIEYVWIFSVHGGELQKKGQDSHSTYKIIKVMTSCKSKANLMIEKFFCDLLITINTSTILDLMYLSGGKAHLKSWKNELNLILFLETPLNV